MDVFKLAFETTIVGISAFLWLGIAIDLISPNFLTHIKSILTEVNPNISGVVLLATAYCLGSAILPISAQLVNDEHWPLPEDAVRCRVVVEEGKRLSLVKYSLPNHNGQQMSENACNCSYWSRLTGLYQATGKENSPSGTPQATLAVNHGATKENRDQQLIAEEQRKKVLTQFELQESRALGQGANKEELFRQLGERIIVLRGAVFNGFVLFLVCLFGCIAPQQEHPSWRRTFLGLTLASFLTIFVIYNGYSGPDESEHF